MRNLDEIIHSVNSMYSKRETTMLSLKDEENGFVSLNTIAEKWYTVLNGTISNFSHEMIL